VIPAVLNLTIYRGATFGPILFTFKDDLGVVINLTGWTVTADARLTTTAAVAFSMGVSITSATAGEVTMTKTDELTRDFTAAIYAWDLFLENTTGQRLGPYITGQVNVKAVNTQP